METTETSSHRVSRDVKGSEVIRLRQWGSDHVYPLPDPREKKHHPLHAWTVGAAPDCDLQIHDPTRRTSRHHATLIREKAYWSLVDVGSKNGIRVDGVPQATSLLDAGQELQIGGVLLIAESVRLIVLRDFLSRILGWGAAASERVDLALRAIRTAVVRRLPLILRGEGDLVPLAAQLHRKMLGPGRPFVLCDPRRTSTDANARSVPNELTIDDALEAARGGTLCLRQGRLPHHYSRAVASLRSASTPSFLIACGGRALREIDAYCEPLVIAVPPLAQRGHELERVVHGYLSEAGQALQVRVTPDEEMIGWIMTHSARTLGEIEKGAQRLTALAASDSLVGAAKLLGVASVSLRRWLRRRSLERRFTTTAAETSAEPTS